MSKISDTAAVARIKNELHYIDSVGVDAMNDALAAKFLSDRIRDIRSILRQTEES